MVAASETWTIGTTLTWTASYLAKKGAESPRLEAELLLCHVLGVSRVDLYTRHDRPLSGGERNDYRAAIRRRVAGEPLQHITGRQGFRLLDLEVGKDVFVPRPETELLVDVVRQAAGGLEEPLIADVGTGSGAIALSLAKEIPSSTVVAVDVSPEALAVARRNADRNGLTERVTWFEGDLLEPLRSRGLRPDVVVANPPYVAEGDLKDLPLEVQRDPRTALLAGPRGLEVHERLALQAFELTTARGIIVVEFGDGQARAVEEILTVAGWGGAAIHKDLAGIERVAQAAKLLPDKDREGP